MQYRIRVRGLSPIICHNGAAGLDTRSAANIEKAQIARRRGSDRTEADEVRLRELECYSSAAASTCRGRVRVAVTGPSPRPGSGGSLRARRRGLHPPSQCHTRRFVQLADVTPGERTKKRSQRGGGHHPKRQHPARRAGP